jgi:hypothetical protein
MTNAGSYIVELERWNVKNDGSEAILTTKGINSALSWASQQGCIEVVLPDGTYLIDENNPIQPQSFMILNLGGSTFKIRDNGLASYSIVSFRNNQLFSRVTNGKIEGDRFTHNFSSGGTHEFGVGVELKYGVRNITVDNLEVYNTTGDAIIAITSFGAIGGGFPNLAGNLETGGINTSDGKLYSSTTRIRTSIKLPMVPQIINTGYFGLYGDSYGGIGSEITTDTYDVVFYKSNDSFLSSTIDVHFFDEVKVPEGASYAKVVLHQSTVPSQKGSTITIRTPQFPYHVYIENCNLHHCRRLGIAICGVKHFHVRGCEIHHISGTAPAGAIDVEDGYDINQYIYMDGNNIYDNNYSIIAVAGKFINITNNRIQSGIFTINAGVNKAIIDNNYFLKSGPRLEGESIFSNNHLFNSKLMLLGKAEAYINNCSFQNSTLNISKEKAFVAQINNCKLYFDDDFYTASVNSGAPINFSIEPQSFTNCIFQGSGIEAFTTVPTGTHDWILNNVSFIDTKHRQGRATVLPPGVYTGCSFRNTGALAINQKPQATFDFNGCTFQWDSYDLFYLNASTTAALFKVQNSTFTGGKKNATFFFWNMGGKIELINNLFEYPNSEVTTPMIDFWSNTFTAESVLIEGNRFTSNLPMIGVNASKLNPSIQFIFSNNIINKAIVKLGGTHLQFNNCIDGKLFR